MSLRQI